MDGGKVVSLTHQPRFTPQKHYFNASVILNVIMHPLLKDCE
jgi:hypothetical protein